jgi:hypothetical protein
MNSLRGSSSPCRVVEPAASPALRRGISTYLAVDPDWAVSTIQLGSGAIRCPAGRGARTSETHSPTSLASVVCIEQIGKAVIGDSCDRTEYRIACKRGEPSVTRR